jgi:site-specific recombinase XerD
MKSKDSFPAMKNKVTIRNLPIASLEFKEYLIEFEKWLRVFGFARTTVYYSPAYLRSFMHFLEGKKISSLDQLHNNHIKQYMRYLSDVISARTGRPLTQGDIKAYIRKYRLPLLKEKGKSREQALLVSDKATRITGNAVYLRLQTLGLKANLPVPISLHTLRHSIATHLLSNGLSLEKIGQFLGHTSLESTQIYTHLIH